MRTADVMTPNVITVRPDDTVVEAARRMVRHGISGLPVVDAEGNLVGIVTEGDFLHRSETGTQRRRPHWLEVLLGPGRLAEDYVRSHARRVAEVMTEGPVTVSEDTPVEEVVHLMERHRVKRLPVIREGRCIGIVSRANLIQALAGVAGEARAGAGDDDDATIRSHVLAELEGQPWAAPACINIIVRKGVVHLWGTIFDEREREALRVAAENAPGVKGVQDHLLWIEPLSGTIIPGEADTAETGAEEGEGRKTAQR
jgi:CBS domain-containing protein